MEESAQEDEASSNSEDIVRSSGDDDNDGENIFVGKTYMMNSGFFLVETLKDACELLTFVGSLEDSSVHAMWCIIWRDGKNAVNGKAYCLPYTSGSNSFGLVHPF